MLPQPPEGLRHWRLADAPALEAAWADPAVRVWNPPPPDADATSWISCTEERWALRLSLDFVIDVDGEVAGEVGLRNFTEEPARAELGIWLGSRYRQRGLATRSVAAVASWAVEELGIAQVWARSHVDNADARGLFERTGWQRLGVTDDRVIWAN